MIMATDPNDRPTAQELAARANGDAAFQIAGKPAAKCPYCGCGMFVNGTQFGSTMIYRYVNCRGCDKSFKAKQPPAVLMYEVEKSNEDSNTGKQSIE